jgi:hypothetical protein
VWGEEARRCRARLARYYFEPPAGGTAGRAVPDDNIADDNIFQAERRMRRERTGGGRGSAPIWTTRTYVRAAQLAEREKAALVRLIPGHGGPVRCRGAGGVPNRIRKREESEKVYFSFG